ncbi:MAG: hypothetical protein ABUL62_15500 [Myxococcales bacterium]|jgi:hypothetical protein
MQISGIRNESLSFEQAATATASPVKAAAGGEPEVAFSRAVRGLGHQIDVGEVQAEAASHLHSYDTGTLIALQVGIYRYTEAVDLASKIVDRATSAVKTVLQGGGH